MFKLFYRLYKNEKGQSFLEYCTILFFISIVVIVALVQIGLFVYNNLAVNYPG